jgi:hypothetical protein
MIYPLHTSLLDVAHELNAALYIEVGIVQRSDRDESIFYSDLCMFVEGN